MVFQRQSRLDDQDKAKSGGLVSSPTACMTFLSAYELIFPKAWISSMTCEFWQVERQSRLFALVIRDFGFQYAHGLKEKWLEKECCGICSYGPCCLVENKACTFLRALKRSAFLIRYSRNKSFEPAVLCFMSGVPFSVNSDKSNDWLFFLVPHFVLTRFER